MSTIFTFFEESKIIQRGENSVSSGFVTKIMFDNELSVIRGEVKANMKNRTFISVITSRRKAQTHIISQMKNVSKNSISIT